MKELIDGANMVTFKKEDIKELIPYLSELDRKKLQLKLNRMDVSEQKKSFYKIRSWVLRKLYPDKFKTSSFFYEDILEMLEE